MCHGQDQHETNTNLLADEMPRLLTSTAGARIALFPFSYLLITRNNPDQPLHVPRQRSLAPESPLEELHAPILNFYTHATKTADNPQPQTTSAQEWYRIAQYRMSSPPKSELTKTPESAQTEARLGCGRGAKRKTCQSRNQR